MAGLTGPGTRRRKQFDDEDEWEDHVIEQKHTQQQGMPPPYFRRCPVPRPPGALAALAS